MTNKNEMLRGLEPYLNQKILGQERALHQIAQVICNGELGYHSDDEPRSSFLMFGPTGVGKTETCLVLSEYLYGDRNALIRLDMSEFMNFNSTNVFLDRIDKFTSRREKEGGILLFDEMEKAHPDILMFFLQMLSAGRLTFNDHRTGNLTRFYMFFTSNLGSELLIEIRSTKFPFTAIEKSVLMRAKQELRPEFFGRVKHKLVYQKLAYDVQRKIAKLYMDKEVDKWGADYSEDCLELMIRKGIDIRYGARPLKGTIEHQVRTALANAELENRLDKKNTISLICKDHVLEVAGLCNI